MPVEADDFRELSDQLIDEFDSEIACRCAISRGYYSLFHFIRQNGRGHPSVNFNERGDHYTAGQLLKHTGDENLADDYYKLKRRRENADYDIDTEIDEMDYQKFLKQLENVRTRVEYLEPMW